MKEVFQITTFFIVDDDHLQHVLYRDMLEFNGHRVIGHAYDGCECVEKICCKDSVNRVEPDIILMDHRMPRKNGLEAMIEMLEFKPDLKVIFISADDSIREKVLSNGAVAFISKPVNISNLIKEIEQVLEISST